MEVITMSNAPQVGQGVNGWKMYQGPKSEIIHLLLKKGEKLEPHSLPCDVVFYVLQGIGNLEVENQVFSMPSHTSIHVAAGKSRLWANNGFSDLRVLVIKLLS